MKRDNKYKGSFLSKGDGDVKNNSCCCRRIRRFTAATLLFTFTLQQIGVTAELNLNSDFGDIYIPQSDLATVTTSESVPSPQALPSDFDFLAGASSPLDSSSEEYEKHRTSEPDTGLTSGGNETGVEAEPLFMLITDDFNRADLGSDWNVVTGKFSILSQELYRPNSFPAYGGMMVYDKALESSNYEIGMDAYFSSNVNDRGLIARYLDQQNYYYASVTRNGSARIYRVMDGTSIVLADARIPWYATNSWHQIKFSVVEDNLKLFVDGQLLLEATDSALETGKPGIKSGMYYHRFDNFSLKVNKTDTTPPIPPPAVLFVPEMTNQVSISLSGDKAAGTAVWLNDVEVVSLDDLSQWGPIQLDLNEGQNQIQLKVRDPGGNFSEPETFTVIRDTIAPEATLVINDGYGFTNQTAVTLNISGADAGTGIDSMRFSLNGGISWTDWVPFQTGHEINLEGPDGVQTVTAEVRDRTGNSRLASQSIILDRVPPQVETVSFITTNDPNYEIEYLIDGTHQTFHEVLVEGNNRIDKMFKDEAGNETAVEWEIVLDTQAPAGEISINDGAEATENRMVSVAIQGTDLVNGMGTGIDINRIRVSADLGHSWTNVSTVPTEMAVTLPEGAGPKEVWLELWDLAGNSTVSKAYIRLETPSVPGQATIYSDDFNRSQLGDEWQVIEGKFAINGNQLYRPNSFPAHTGMAIYNLDPGKHGISLELAVFYSSNMADRGLVARYQDKNNYYYASVDRYGIARITKVADGIPVVLAQSKGLWLSTNSWHSLRFVLEGDVLQVFLDDTLRGETSDESFRGGKTGVRSGAYYHTFDDFSLTILDPELISAVFESDPISESQHYELEYQTGTESFLETWRLGSGTNRLPVFPSGQFCGYLNCMHSVEWTAASVPGPDVSVWESASESSIITTTGSDGAVFSYLDGQLLAIEYPDQYMLIAPEFNGDDLSGGLIRFNNGKEIYYQNAIVVWMKTVLGDFIYLNEDGSVREVVANNGKRSVYSYRLNGSGEVDLTVVTEDTQSAVYGQNCNLVALIKANGDELHFENGMLRTIRKTDGAVYSYETTVNSQTGSREMNLTGNGADQTEFPQQIIYDETGDVMSVRLFREQNGANVLFQINFENGLPIEAIEDPEGAALVSAYDYSFDALGNLDFVTSQTLGYVQQFDQNGRLTAIETPEGETIGIQDNAITSLRLASGTVIEAFTLSDEGSVESGVVVQPDGTRLTYDEGKLIRIKTSAGLIYELSQLQDGTSVATLVDAVHAPSEAMTEFTYDQDMNIVGASSLSGEILQFMNERVMRVEIPDGEPIEMEYVIATDDPSRVLETITHQGDVTTYFDENRQITKSVIQMEADSQLELQYEYGKIRKSYRNGTLFSNYQYDFDAAGHELLTVSEVESGITRHYVSGLLMKTAQPDGVETRYTHDSEGNVLSSEIVWKERTLYSFDYSYDDDLTFIADEQGIVRGYDADDRFVRLIQDNQVFKIYEVEEQGLSYEAQELIQKKFPNGDIAYYSMGQVVRIEYADGGKLEHIIEDESGNLFSAIRTFPDGTVERLTGGSRVEIALPDKTFLVYENGALMQSSDVAGNVWTYWRDGSDVIVRNEQTLGSNRYNSSGIWIETIQPDGTVLPAPVLAQGKPLAQILEETNSVYAVTTAGDESGITSAELSQRTLSSGAVVSYENGHAVRIALPDGSVITDILLDSSRNLVRATVTHPSGVRQIFNDFGVLEEIHPDSKHIFYSNNRITKIIDPVLGELNYTYETDESGEVSRVWAERDGIQLELDNSGDLLGAQVPVELNGWDGSSDFYSSGYHAFYGEGTGAANGWQGIDGDFNTFQGGSFSGRDGGQTAAAISTHYFASPQTLHSLTFQFEGQGWASGNYNRVHRAGYAVQVCRKELCASDADWETIPETYVKNEGGGNGTTDASSGRVTLSGLNLTGVTAIKAYVFGTGEATGGEGSYGGYARLYEISAELSDEGFPEDAAVSYAFNLDPSSGAYRFESDSGTYFFDADGGFISSVERVSDQLASLSRFNDVSPARRYVQLNGNVGISNSNELFQNSNAVFDGAGDFLYIQDHTDWDFGTSDFAIDFQVRFEQMGGTQTIVDVQNADETGVRISYDFTAGVYIVKIQGHPYLYEAAQFNPQEWHHIALTRTGSALRFFMDGVQLGDVRSNTADLSGGTAGIYIGCNFIEKQFLNGQIDDLRISSGTARWDASFSVPSVRHTSDPQTELLLHFDNEDRFQFQQAAARLAALQPVTSHLERLPEGHTADVDSFALWQSDMQEAILPSDDVFHYEYDATGTLVQTHQADQSVLQYRNGIPFKWTSAYNVLLSQYQINVDDLSLESFDYARLVENSEAGATALNASDLRGHVVQRDGAVITVQTESGKTLQYQSGRLKQESETTLGAQTHYEYETDGSITVRKNGFSATYQNQKLVSFKDFEGIHYAVIEEEDGNITLVAAGFVVALDGSGHVVVTEGTLPDDTVAVLEARFSGLDLDLSQKPLSIRNLELDGTVSVRETGDFVIGNTDGDGVIQNYTGFRLETDDVLFSIFDDSEQLVRTIQINGMTTEYESGKVGRIWDRSGNLVARYSYDEDGILVRVELIQSRETVTEQILKARMEIELLKGTALSDLAERHAEGIANIEAEYGRAMTDVQSQKERLEAQRFQRVCKQTLCWTSCEMVEVQGVAAEIQKAEAALIELVEGKAAALAELDEAVETAHANVTSEIAAAFSQIDAYERDIQRDILSQEWMPVIFAWYRAILGRDPDLAEYDYWINQTRFDLALNLDELKAALYGGDEFDERTAFVAAVKSRVRAFFESSEEAKDAFRVAFDIETQAVTLDAGEADAMLNWLDSRSLHFGQSAYLALEKLLQEDGAGYDRVELASDLILIDMLTGVITPWEQGDLVISMYALEKAALYFGALALDAVRIDYEKLLQLETDAEGNLVHKFVAHINGNHFIIVTRVEAGKITYIDPGMGRDYHNQAMELDKADFLAVWNERALMRKSEIDFLQTMPNPPPGSQGAQVPEGGTVDTETLSSGLWLLSTEESMQVRGAFFGSIFKFFKNVFSAVFDYVLETLDFIFDTAIHLITFQFDEIFQDFKDYLNARITLIADIGRAVRDLVADVVSIIPVIGKPLSGFVRKAGTFIIDNYEIRSRAVIAILPDDWKEGLNVLKSPFQFAIDYFTAELQAGVAHVARTLGASDRTAQRIAQYVSGAVKIIAGVVIAIFTGDVRVLASGVQDVALAAGLDPQLALAISTAGTALIGGAFDQDPTTTVFQALKKSAPKIAASFTYAGVVAAGSVLGFDSRLAQLVGLGTGAILGNLTDSLLNPSGGGGPGGIFQTLKDAFFNRSTLDGLVSIGAELLGEALDVNPLLISLGLRGLVGGIEGLSDRENDAGAIARFFTGMGGALKESLTNIVTLGEEHTTPTQKAFYLLQLIDLATKKGNGDIFDVFEIYAAQILGYDTVESIFSTGQNISDYFKEKRATGDYVVRTLEDGIVVHEYTVGNNKFILNEDETQILARHFGSNTESGQYGIDPEGRYVLINGEMTFTDGAETMTFTVRDAEVVSVDMVNSQGSAISFFGTTDQPLVLKSNPESVLTIESGVVRNWDTGATSYYVNGVIRAIQNTHFLDFQDSSGQLVSGSIQMAQHLNIEGQASGFEIYMDEGLRQEMLNGNQAATESFWDFVLDNQNIEDVPQNHISLFEALDIKRHEFADNADAVVDKIFDFVKPETGSLLEDILLFQQSSGTELLRATIKGFIDVIRVGDRLDEIWDDATGAWKDVNDGNLSDAGKKLLSLTGNSAIEIFRVLDLVMIGGGVKSLVSSGTALVKREVADFVGKLLRQGDDVAGEFVIKLFKNSSFEEQFLKEVKTAADADNVVELFNRGLVDAEDFAKVPFKKSTGLDQLIEAAQIQNKLTGKKTTVLGHFSDTKNYLGKDNLNMLNFDDAGLTYEEIWDINRQWLDDVIARGDDVLLVTEKPTQFRPDGNLTYYFRELEYLSANGYKRIGNFLKKVTD